MVIFGATGDLTKRKLIPALYNLVATGCCRDEFAVVGVGRSPLTDDEFRAAAWTRTCSEFATADGRRRRSCEWLLAAHCTTSPAISTTPRRSSALARRWRRLDEELGTGGNYLFYLAVPPSRLRRLRPAARRGRPAREEEGQLAARDHREAVRPRPRVRARAEPRDPRGAATRSRSTASITTSARRRCRTSWRSASPTASSSRSGTAATSITCRSPSPRPWASRGAAATTTRPARCATWCRTTCSSSSR